MPAPQHPTDRAAARGTMTMHMTPNGLLIAAAAHSAAFALFHLGFWRLFSWRTELAKISRVNRGIMQVLNLCLTYVFVATAWLVASHRGELLSTRLGQSVLLGIAGFWALRLAEQFVFFDMKPPRSWVLSGLFLVGAVLHAAPVLLVK